VGISLMLIFIAENPYTAAQRFLEQNDLSTTTSTKL
jgi:hypothetical protein